MQPKSVQVLNSSEDEFRTRQGAQRQRQVEGVLCRHLLPGITRQASSTMPEHKRLLAGVRSTKPSVAVVREHAAEEVKRPQPFRHRSEPSSKLLPVRRSPSADGGVRARRASNADVGLPRCGIIKIDLQLGEAVGVDRQSWPCVNLFADDPSSVARPDQQRLIMLDPVEGMGCGSTSRSRAASGASRPGCTRRSVTTLVARSGLPDASPRPLKAGPPSSALRCDALQGEQQQSLRHRQALAACPVPSAPGQQETN